MAPQDDNARLPTAAEVKGLVIDCWPDITRLMIPYGVSELAAFYVLEGALAGLMRHPSRPSQRRTLLLESVEARCTAMAPETPEGENHP